MSRKHVLAKTTVRSLFGEGWVGRHGVPAFDTNYVGLDPTSVLQHFKVAQLILTCAPSPTGLPRAWGSGTAIATIWLHCSQGALH